MKRIFTICLVLATITGCATPTVEYAGCMDGLAACQQQAAIQHQREARLDAQDEYRRQAILGILANGLQQQVNIQNAYQQRLNDIRSSNTHCRVSNNGFGDIYCY